MLVLNTNEFKWFIHSNQEIGCYPDFSQILILPPSISWVDTNEALSVNWTVINQFSQSINNINYNSWNLLNWNPIWSSDIGLVQYWTASSITTKSRIWVLWKMKWGEIIGKRMCMMPTVIFWRAASNTWSHSWSASWTIAIKLLHSNWTLTTIGTFSINISQNHNGWQAKLYKSKWLIVIETVWYVAQEWDIVVADIDITTQWHWQYSYGWFSFWSLWSSDFDTQPHPIQISID